MARLICDCSISLSYSFVRQSVCLNMNKLIHVVLLWLPLCTVAFLEPDVMTILAKICHFYVGTYLFYLTRPSMAPGILFLLWHVEFVCIS